MRFTAGRCVDDPEYPGGVIIAPHYLSADEVTVIDDQLVANTFRFLLPNVDSKMQEVEVQAWLDTDTFAQPNELIAAATIGLGSMIVQIPQIVPDDEGTETKPVSLN